MPSRRIEAREGYSAPLIRAVNASPRDGSFIEAQ
jgi:hypothetical protein